MKTRDLAILLVATTILAGCASGWRVHDLTLRGPATCEIHNLAMTRKRVTEACGLRIRTNPMDLVRPELFPHADEPYDTQACMRCHNYARIWVCAKCSNARTAWLGGQARRP
jgi:hypothetical protein